MSWKKFAALLTGAGMVLCFAVAAGRQNETPVPVEEPDAIQEEPIEGEPVQETLAPSPEEMVEPEQKSEPEVPVYDYTQPAPAGDAVENTYFTDAAFVGDSRTDGFMIYSGIGNGDNLTSNGLSIFKLASKKTLKIGGENYTLLEALARKEYGKVYLCLGVNELGIYDDEGFYQSYLSAIDSIRATQPKAIIYIQGLIPLNETDVAAAGGREYLKNDRLRVYNDLMRQAAQEKQVVFLDLYTEFADENGELPSGASRDGVHLSKEYCQKWLAYLQTHTVAPELLGLAETETKEDAPV